jgi:dihydroneopterin aldolase
MIMRVGAEHEIHVEQLKVLAHVGVSKAERSKRQRLALNVTAWPARDLRDVKDAVGRTVDYAVLCREIKTYLTQRSPKLLETLAHDLAAYLLRKFRIRKIRLEVRKFVLKEAAYVSVTVTGLASVD